MTTATVIRTCGACQQEFSDNDVYEAHCHEHMVGFCPKCRRWDHWGERCPRCGSGFDGQEECHQELRHQFSELVLALQDVVQHGEIGRPDGGKGSVSLDPKMWGIDPRGIVKAAMNPLFWANMTSQDLRMAIGLLSSVAGQYGVTTVGTRNAGAEVTMTHDDGTVHLYWRDGKSGNMSHIRQMEQPHTLRDHFKVDPTQDIERSAEAIQAFNEHFGPDVIRSDAGPGQAELNRRVDAEVERRMEIARQQALTLAQERPDYQATDTENTAGLAEAKQSRMVLCSTCHQPFAAGVEIIRHRREHQG